jgi:Uma2 family endonuclease
MAVEKQRFLTVEEFEQFADASENRERLLELIDGEVIERVPTEKHGMIVGNIYGPIWNFVQQHKSGRVVMEVRHRVTGDRHNARLPDISYIGGKRPVVEKGSVPRMPDLAVEVKSPDDSLKSMREKARYYLAHGTQLVWLVDPEKRLVEVYTPDDEQVLTENEALSGGNVLSDFTLPVRDIFVDSASA